MRDERTPPGADAPAHRDRGGRLKAQGHETRPDRKQYRTATEQAEGHAARLRAALACDRPRCPCMRPGPAGMTHCPSHDDRSPSLTVHIRDGRVLWHCQAGCTQDAVVGALRARGLWPNRNGHHHHHTGGSGDGGVPGRRIVATYDYVDAAGRLLFQVVRFSPKDFRQRRPDGRGGFTWNLDGVTPVLYRLPEVLEAARRGATIYVAEGEKDVEALRTAGAVATCNPGGAGKWRTEFAETLRGAHVVVVRDKDDPGRRHAEAVVASLRGVAQRVRLVEARAGKDAADHLAAGFGLADFVEVPLPQPPDGAALLTAVEGFIRRYCVLPDEAAYVAMTLWAAHAHALDSFESTPRLAFLSPEPECGKTRALEVLELLVPRPMLAVNATPAALFRAVADQEKRPTVLFDEIDTIFGPKAKENEELRGLLNAGHRRSGVAYRCVGEGTKQEVREFPAYAAVALAGIGDLPDTLLSRSIVIAMRRRAPHERVQPFRRREAEADGTRLRERLAEWVSWHRQALANVPAMPEGLADRAADVWEPLLAVADAAGGEWPARARVAAVALVAAKAEKEPSLGVRLLADIRAVFDREGRDALPTAVLLERLHGIDEAPWQNLHGKPLDAYGLARRLAGYGVRSKNIRDGAAVVKGYERAGFAEAWARYLPALPGTPRAEGEGNDAPPGGSDTTRTDAPRAASSLRRNPATSATSATRPGFESARGPRDVADYPAVADGEPLQQGVSATGFEPDVAPVADVAGLWQEERNATTAADDLPFEPVARGSEASLAAVAAIVLDAAERCGWPRRAVGGRVVHGPEGWRAFVTTAAEEALWEALVGLE
jgi:5S rRNA maturation endonuclease (ribonuclease M5)